MQGSAKHGIPTYSKSLFAVSLILCWSFIFSNALAGQGGLGAEAAAPNSVTLSWTAPGDDSTTGTASQYDLRYSTANITDANWNSANQVSGEPAPKIAGSAESFTVTGLQPSTTYYFAIKAADEASNWSVLSNVVSKSTTAEITPPAAIANLATGTTTAVSVALTSNW